MPPITRFGGFEVDLASGELRKRGIRIHLREQSFQALALLLERPGEVVSREELRQRLWPADVFVDFENNLNNAIARLREALGDSADRPRLVETLPRRGYRFIGHVEGTDKAAGPAAPPTRLLVLPFVNLSGDAGQEYLSDAMTEEVITALAGLTPGQLGVIARTTSMRYKGTEKDVGQIGRELRVDHVLEGSVRQQDGRLAVTAQLIRTQDQTHLLARRDEVPLDELFDLSTAIAQTVAHQIGVTPRPQPGVRAKRPPTADVAAYHLYLRARGALMFWESPAHFAAARQYLLEAIARDPRFALAYDALAELHWYVGFAGMAPAREMSAASMSYAVQALTLDDTLAETHALLAILLKEVEFDWAAVKREIDRAMELDPASPLVRLRYAIGWLLPTGRFGEAVHEIESALESDPQSTLMRAWLACHYWLNREYGPAIEQARLAIAFDPEAFTGYWMLGMVSREAGRFEEAIGAHRTAVELSGEAPLMLGWLGLALGQAGHTTEARTIVDRLHAQADTRYVPPSGLAWTHYALGDIDEAFAWLDRAIDERDAMIFPLHAYPFLDPIRTDPRFAALLRRLNYDPAGGGIRQSLVGGSLRAV